MAVWTGDGGVAALVVYHHETRSDDADRAGLPTGGGLCGLGGQVRDPKIEAGRIGEKEGPGVTGKGMHAFHKVA